MARSFVPFSCFLIQVFVHMLSTLINTYTPFDKKQNYNRPDQPWLTLVGCPNVNSPILGIDVFRNWSKSALADLCGRHSEMTTPPLKE